MKSIGPAPAPGKEHLLGLLEELRVEVEAGETLALLVVPIHPELRFSVRSAGEISMSSLAGLLGRAWMDATDALKEGA